MATPSGTDTRKDWHSSTAKTDRIAKAVAVAAVVVAGAVVGVALVILICLMVGSVIIWEFGAAPAFTD